MTDYKALIHRIQLFYKLALYGERDTFLNAIAQGITYNNPSGGPLTEQERMEAVKGKIPPPPPAALPAPTLIEVPEQVITGTPPVQAIPTDTQDQLNDLLVPAGLLAVPLALDGKLGPKTQQAAQAFKAKYNMPATPANIKAVHLKEYGPSEVKSPF